MSTTVARSAETLEGCATAIATDFTPLSDHRGSAWYRSTLAANLLRGFFDDVAVESMPRLPDRPTGTLLGGPRA
jgi:xanthine dehydrogenase small subunit